MTPGLPGLVNLGNTCFLNSTLQALGVTQPLSDLLTYPNPAAAAAHPILSYIPGLAPSPDVSPAPIPITIALSDLLYKLSESRVTIRPSTLLQELSRKREEYADFQQQDAHELLRVLIDAMEMEELDLWKKLEPPVARRKARRKETLRPASARARFTTEAPPAVSSNSSSSDADSNSSGPDSDSDSDLEGQSDLKSPARKQPLVDALFGGRLTQFIVCDECKHVSRVNEDFMDLSLGIRADKAHDKISRREKLRRTIQGLRPTGVSTKASTDQLRPKVSAVSDTSDTDADFDGAGITRRRSLDPAAMSRAKKGFWGSRSRDVSPSGESSAGVSRSSSRGKAVSRERPRIPRATDEQKAYVRKVLAEVPGGAPSPLQALRFAQPHPPARPLPVPPLESVPPTAANPAETGLHELLRRFTAVETLEGDNVYSCRACWKHLHPKEAKERAEKKAREKGGRSGTILAKGHKSSDMEEPGLKGGNPDATVESAHEGVREGNAVGGTMVGPTAKNETKASPPIMAESPISENVPTAELCPPPALMVTAASLILPPRPPSTVSELPYNSDTTSLDSSSGTDARHRKEPPLKSDNANNEGRFAALVPLALNKNTSTTSTASVSFAPALPIPSRQPGPPVARRHVLRRAHKRYLFSSLPPILVIHLKRFYQSSKSSLFGGSGPFGDLKKVDELVSFPLELDFGAFLAPGGGPESSVPRHRRGWFKEHGEGARKSVEHSRSENRYRLYAVVVHLGTLGSGHYVAYVLSGRWKENHGGEESEKERERRWLYCSDGMVRAAGVDEVLRCKAYMLFYERV